MKNTIRPNLILLLAVLQVMIRENTRADTIAIFQVDMSAQIGGGSFIPGTDTVSAQGTFNNWGPGVALTNNATGSNPNLYTGTLDDTVDANGGIMQMKYVINGTNYENTLDSDNRLFILPATGGASFSLPYVYFADAGPAQTYNIGFQVDMAQQINLGNFIPGTSGIYAQGSFNGWSDSLGLTNDPSILRTNQYGGVTSNVYTGVLQFTAPPGATAEYKYVINSGSSDNYENPSGADSDPYNSNNRFFWATNETLPLVFFGDIPLIPPDTCVWTNTAGGSWSVASNWNPNRVPGPNDHVYITTPGSYEVVLDVGATVNSLILGGDAGQQTLADGANYLLTLNNFGAVMPNGVLEFIGGSLGGAGSVTVSGVFNWHGGELSASSSLEIANRGVLNIEGNINIIGVLTNQGTVSWHGGSITVYNNAGNPFSGAIWNEPGALWDIQCDQPMNCWQCSGSEQFHNLGTVRKSAGSGTNNFGVYLDNRGIFHSENGTINLTGGANLGGIFQADAGTAFYLGAGAFTGTLAGTLNVSGAQFGPDSALTIGTSGVLNISGAVTIQGVLTNQGTVTWQDGMITIYNNAGNPFSGAIWNEAGALWDIQCDQPMNCWQCTGSEQFHNLGTVRKSAGGGTTTFDVYLDSSGTVHAETGTIQANGGGGLAGRFQADTGAAVYFSGGVATLNGAQNFQGPGQVGINGVGVVDGTLSGALNLYGGGIAVGSVLTIATNGVLNIAGAVTVQGVLTNQGTVNWQAGAITIYNNSGSPYTGAIWNEAGALWDIQCDQPMNCWQCSGFEQFHNLGTVRKSAGSGTNGLGVYLDNSGTISMENGTINLAAGANLGGIFQASAGTAFYLGGGVFTGTLAGTFNVSGGQFGLGSALTIATNGVMNIGGTLAIQGVLTNQGTVTWQDGTIMMFNNAGNPYTGAIWNEVGALWDTQCDQPMNCWQCNGSEQFHNLGTLRKSAGSGTNTFNIYLDNGGTLDAESGTMSLSGGFALTGGTMSFGISNLTSFGQIYLSGSPAGLDGSISAHLNGGYVPATNDSFQLLSYPSFAGSFTNTNLPALAVWKTTTAASALTITVIQLVPTVTWADPADIVYGTPLGGAQLDATAASPASFGVNLPGRLSYNPPLGTILDAGSNQTLSVTFTPVDTFQYTTVTTNVAINVQKAPLIVTANSGSKTYGQAVTFTGTEFTTTGLVNGDTVTSVTLACSGAAATATVAGSPYPIIPSAAQPASLTNNYIVTYQNGQLTVNPALLTLTANSRGKIYGQTAIFAGTEFAANGLVNGDSVAGVTLTSSGAAPAAGVAASPYAIVPSAAVGAGLGNYAITYAAGRLTVSPAALSITATNEIKYSGQTLTFHGTEFVASGMENSETVGSVTLASDGAAANASVGSYSIVASLAAGGTFNPGNYTITYQDGTLSVLALPTLHVEVVNKMVVLFWTTNAIGFSLQATTELLNPGGWASVSGSVVVGDQNVVTNPVSGKSAFYRLKLQP